MINRGLGMFLSPLGPPVDINPLLFALTGRGQLPDGTNVVTTRGFSDGHKAWDAAMPAGTPVIAQHAGEISQAGPTGGDCGTTVAIDGGPLGLRSRTCHLSAIATQSGNKVKKGDVIGFSGNTGRSTGPHWHGQEAFCNAGSCGPLRSPRLLLGASEVLGWGVLFLAVAVTAGVIFR